MYDYGTDFLGGCRPIAHFWNLIFRQRLPDCGNRRASTSVYFLYQGTWNGENVIANGVLYPPIIFMRRIGNNRLTILEADYVGLCAGAQCHETKECQIESQSKKL